MEFSTLIKFIMLLSSTLPLIGVADSKIVVSGNRGRNFHLGLLYGSPNYQFESIAIINTLTEAANVSIFNLFDKSKASYFIPANSSRKVIFDQKLLNKDVGLTNRSVIVSSDNDIQMDVYQMHPLSGDGYLALPTNAMGPEYVITTYTPTIASQFLVLAHINSTEIFISFPSETSYLGQTYSRKRMLHVAIPHEHGFFFSSTTDLTGTLIYSNHDLVVIAGNPCTTIPLGVQYCDFLIEQLLPTRQLGRNYLLGNFADRKFGDIYRVVAASPNITTVWINTIQQNLTLPQGSFIEFDIIGSNNTYLSCSQECLVAHFNKGFRTDNVLTDSMMVIVADMEQYRSEYVLSTLPSESSYNIDRLYLNIYISTIYKDGLLLDGVIMKNLQWKEIFINTTVNDSSINYVFTAIVIKPGRHVLHHINNSATFGVTQYGYGQATAYGLLAGIKLNFTARYAPRIVQQPQSINITEDKNGFLECNATASPEPIIIWLKNGRDLEADINGTHLKDFHLYGRYNFLHADANDEGEYQCKYTNDVGNAISKIANVFVFRPPDPVRNVEVRNITSFGLNISWLPPKFDGHQPITNYTVRLLNYRNTTLKHPCQFSYIRDGCIIENTATYYSNLTPYTIYYLAIEANNIVGESLSQFIKVWTDEFYPKGQVQNLHALGYNLTTIKITWKPPRYPNGKIGYLVYQWSIYPINGTDTRLNFLYNGTDTYTYTYGLLRNSTRYYQVIPYNIKYSLFGNDSDIVNGTNFIQAPLGYSQKINGIPALFSIHLTWLPPPVSDRGGVIISYSIKYNSSKWNHNNVTITKSANTSIILHNLIPFMEYKITIKAATAAGYGPESPSLFITTLQAVPSVQPLLQNVSLVNNNTIRMEWETISTRNRRGIILGYYLLLRNTRFGTVENRTINANEVTMIGKNENLTASNLLYYSSYKVSLQAFTIAGPSPRSIEFDVNTLQSVPGIAPLNLTAVRGVYPGSMINLTWNHLPLIYQNGILIGYQIRYSIYFYNNRTQTSATIVELGDFQEYVLTDLLPSRNYSIQIAAVNMIGIGKFSKTVTLATDYGVVTHITVMPRSISAIAGDNIALQCQANGDPIPKVQWLINNTNINQAYQHGITTINGKSTLAINNIGNADKGSYSCRFSNALGINLTTKALVSVYDNRTVGYCLSEIASNMRWVKTAKNSTAKSKCPVNAAGEASRLCKLNVTDEEIVLGQYWNQIDTTNCTSISFLGIENLGHKLDIQGLKVSNEVLDTLINKTGSSKLFGGDINIAIVLLDKINNLSAIVQESVLNKFLAVQSNLVDPRNSQAWKFSNKFCPKRPNGLSILEIVERYASKVEIDSNSSTMANTTKNLAIKVHAINISTVPQEFLTWADTEFDSKMKLRLPVEDILKEPMINRWVTISYLNLHKSIPTSRIGNINFLVAHEKIIVNTHIITTALHQRSSNNLSNPIEIDFVYNYPVIRYRNFSIKSVCAYWKSNSKTCGWALDGCGLSTSSNITHGTCICNHTGTIAALMLIVPAKIIKLQPFLVVACVLSVICIAATVLVHVYYWQLVKGTLSHINLQMFITIFVTDITLLSGLASTESEFFCGFTAVLLHYTILAALMWMISRNLHILYMLAKGNRVENKFKIYAILSIGIPFSISFLTAVITILGTSFDDYIDRNPTACWLSHDPPILLTCFVPLLVLGLGNCVLIACSYIKIKNRPITTKKDNDRYFNTIRQETENGIILFAFSFPVWICFLIFTTLDSLVAQYIFAICILLQGLFIAIIFGFRNVFLADYSNGRSKENLDIKLVKRQRKMKERALLNVQKSKSATASGKNHDKGENDITEENTASN